MPRPKRTKVAPTTRTTSSAAPPLTRRDPARQASERVEDVSDDSEGLVTTTSNFKSQRPLDDPTLRMSGGLGLGDDMHTPQSPGAKRKMSELSQIAREADHAEALERLKKRRDEAKRKEREGDDVLVPATMEETVEATAESTEGKRSGLGRGTPAMDSSALVLANFKRRPRQSSILQMVQAQPSSEDDYGDLDDFNPDDESTPLKTGCQPPVQDEAESSPHPPSPANPRKRKLTPPENQPAVQVPCSSPPVVVSPVESAATGHSSSSLSSRNLPEDGPMNPSTREPGQHAADGERSGTMAPPASSSPSQHRSTMSSTAQIVPAGRPPRRPPAARKQPSRNAQAAASTTSKYPGRMSMGPTSHRAATSSSARPGKDLLHLSTATLQDLLPRRRRRGPPDEFEIPSSDEAIDTSGLGADDDELSHLPTRTLGVRSRHAAKSRPATTRKSAAPSRPTYARPPGKVYTRRRASNKENEIGNHGLDPADDDGGTEDASSATETGRGGARANRELRAVAKKFRAVDEWALEFETVTASSSSPWDAR